MCNKNIDNNCDFVLVVVVDLVTKGGVDNDSVPNLQRCVIKDQGQRKTSSINDSDDILCSLPSISSRFPAAFQQKAQTDLSHSSPED